MQNKLKRINIFFAIPCGEFFSSRNQCIKNVCETARIEPIIVEDHSQTYGLWRKITQLINSAEYFIADISSKSPNVIVELGYSLKGKKPKFCAIFIAENISVPVNLQGFTLQKYTSLRDFQEKLIKWMVDNIKGISASKLTSLKIQPYEFHEDFMDWDKFLKLWTFPNRSAFNLTHEGLRLSNTHFPIITTHLSLLQNYEFEFKAKILRGQLGWIVKGTRRLGDEVPAFFIMFNINQEGILRPHILNLNRPEPPPLYYHIFKNEQQKVPFNISEEGWFSITTKVVGDKIIIFNDGKTIFDKDFTVDPYREYYEFPDKQGEVGFRCHPGEVGIIRDVKVREIE